MLLTKRLYTNLVLCFFSFSLVIIEIKGDNLFASEGLQTLINGKSGINQSSPLTRPIHQQLTNDSPNAQIMYWLEGDPGYRWYGIMIELSKAYPQHRNGGRMVALHYAHYRALRALEEKKLSLSDSQKQIEVDGINIRVSERNIFSRLIVALVSSEILKYYFDDATEDIDRQIKSCTHALSQIYRFTDAEMETIDSIVKAESSFVINWANENNTDLEIDTIISKRDSYWYGRPGKKDITKDKWRPFTYEDQGQFRPPPPPNFDDDMEELRQFNAQNLISDKAWSWKIIPFWDNVLDEKILANYASGSIDDLEAARIRFVFHVGRYDATIAAWEAKYHYMGIRPFQMDEDFKPILVNTPNFPGYPAGHTAVSGSLEVIMTHFFPWERDRFVKMSEECSESRFEGGVHFRTDNEVGLEMGRSIGKHVLDVLVD